VVWAEDDVNLFSINGFPFSFLASMEEATITGDQRESIGIRRVSRGEILFGLEMMITDTDVATAIGQATTIPASG
jgi:hypothetical protein